MWEAVQDKINMNKIHYTTKKNRFQLEYNQMQKLKHEEQQNDASKDCSRAIKGQLI